MVKEYKCSLCGKCHLKDRRPIKSAPLKKYVSSIIGRIIENDEVICGKCRTMFNKSAKTNVQTNNNHSEDSDSEFVVENPPIIDIQSPKTIHLNISSTHTSHKYCIICKKKGNKRVKLCVVPLKARTQAFIQNAIFVDSKARCCTSHLQELHFSQASLMILKAKYTKSFFSRTDIVALLENVRLTMSKSSILDFDNPSRLTDDDYYNLTGLTRQQFEDLSTYSTTIRQSNVRSVRTCLAILLTKLRTGLPNQIIGTIFSLTKSQVQRSIHSARTSLQSFVTQNVGFQHISHDDFVENHTTATAQTLFGNNEKVAIIVLDGTYIYIQKSSDYKFQRQSYSLHKHRPLVKPMVVVGTDGYILSVLGPYLSNGKNNDAAITKHMVAVNAEGMNEWLQQDDVCIVDRGFRDVVEYLEQQGYSVQMPLYLKKGQKQHTTEEANSSRLVTKVRWIVESVNGRLKQWRFFDKVVSNHYIPFIGELLRLVCALCNKYRPAIASSNADDIKIAEAMLDKSKKGNLVQAIVENEGLITKRVIYTLVDGSSADQLKDFPVLSEEKLRQITMGIYQLKQSPLYVREHIGEDSVYQLYVCKIKENLIKIKLQSRFSNSATHNVFVQYTLDGEISGWYCSCKVGARIVGCCAHVSSVLWYLGLHRLQNTSINSPRFTKSVLDASDLPDLDTDSDGSSVVEE
ncbi:uncharacterized protein [Mytilus edulis]|uniref:uncharacterized protein n=1 Tax=Mytilus edulis TaxID=6550 RepID=UPI0039EF3B2D